MLVKKSQVGQILLCVSSLCSSLAGLTNLAVWGVLKTILGTDVQLEISTTTR